MHGRLPRFTRVVVVAGALGLGLGLAPAHTAHAQTPSEIATARQWFADGLAHEEKSEYPAALDLFRRAAQVKKTPQIVYHLGFCESRTGALVEALVDLDSAATLARAAHMDNVVSAAQTELVDVNLRIPSLDVRVQAGASPARFIVDGSAIALSMLHSKMPLNPGEHTVTIEFASGASATKKATLAERDAKTMDLAPPEAVSAVAAPPVVPVSTTLADSSPPPASTARSSSVPAWILVGVGGAATIGGALLVLSAHGKESTLHEGCPSRTGCDPILQSTYDSAKTMNTLGLAIGAVGIAAAGVGISMLVLRSSSSSTTSTALVVTPRGFDLTTRF